MIDLEATCADDGTIAPEFMETIELGAVWATESGEVIERFQRFVRPVERPQLTPFCVSLTGIQQSDVDNASTWPAAASELREFATLHRHPDTYWRSWGDYDRRQIERECARHGTLDPLPELPHRNLRVGISDQRDRPFRSNVTGDFGGT